MPTLAPVSEACAAGTRMTKPRPTHTRPNPNFDELAGWFLPHFSHNHANRGARMKIRIALTDCHQLLGKSYPKIVLVVLRSANRFSVDPACSKTDQNNAAATKYTPMM